MTRSHGSKLDQQAFADFLLHRRNDLRRILRNSPDCLELGDVESEAWVAAQMLSERWNRALDLRDAADQDALLGRLYAQLVKWTGMSVRHALHLDHGPSDEEDHRPSLANMLRASHDSDPEFRQVLREERLAFLEVVRGSYSQAAAYVLLLIRVEWELRDLADLLWIGVETLRHRMARCAELAGIQPTLFDGIDQMDPGFEPTRRMRAIGPPVLVGLLPSVILGRTRKWGCALRLTPEQLAPEKIGAQLAAAVACAVRATGALCRES